MLVAPPFISVFHRDYRKHSERNIKGMKMNLFKHAAGVLFAAATVLSVIVVTPKKVSAAGDRTLPPAGGELAITDQECTVMIRDYNWVSYTALKDGYLRLSFSNNTKSKLIGHSYGNICLYDAGKTTPLSAPMHYDTDDSRAFMTSEYFGVKKGATYKIRISSIGGVKMHASFKAVNKKLYKNIRKQKAVTLKKKKQRDGIVQPGDMKSHYYKFKVTKRQKIKFMITPYLTDDFYFIISGPKLKKSKIRVAVRSSGGKHVYSNYWGKKRTLETPVKAMPGTYYMEVKPIGGTCNGYYKISWK